MNFKVVEKFVSINGEGQKAGQLAVFIRFAGCNLNCSYCDTKWANKPDVKYELMDLNEIYDYVKTTKVKNVTLTGGEPLCSNGIIDLLNILSKDDNIQVEIETNGSINLNKFSVVDRERVSFTMDYKLPSSKMEDKMELNNFNYLTNYDTIKFVVGSMVDLERAKCIIDKYNLVKITNVYISPVFGEINMEDIVEFMKINNMNGVNLQIQLHKIIWKPEKRGV